MVKHSMALIYEEKIPIVLIGGCNHLIRPARGVVEDDVINLHGTVGPTRKWSWRRTLVVTDVDTFWATNKVIKDVDGGEYEWDSLVVSVLARLDGIVPVSGTELFKVLSRWYSFTGKWTEWELIEFRMVRPRVFEQVSLDGF